MRIKISKGERLPALKESVTAVHERVRGPVTFEDLPDEYDPFKHGITFSLLSAFAICPEKFRLGYVERWTPVKTGKAIDFGNVVHAALETVYSAIGTNMRLGIDEGKPGNYSIEELAKQVLTKHMAKAYTDDKTRLEQNTTGLPDEFDELEETYGLAHVTLEAYFDNWSVEHAHMRWVALEKEVSVPFTLPDGRVIHLHMKLDGVFRSGDDLWLMETKTKGRIDEVAIVDKLAYDAQVHIYLLGLEHQYKEMPKGVLYNILRRSQLRQKKTERRVDFLKRIKDDIADRPDFYFVQNRVSFYEDEIRRARVDLAKRINQFIYAWEERNFYRESGACDMIGRTCPFVCLCSGSPIRGLYTREKTFAELETV